MIDPILAGPATASPEAQSAVASSEGVLFESMLAALTGAAPELAMVVTMQEDQSSDEDGQPDQTEDQMATLVPPPSRLDDEITAGRLGVMALVVESQPTPAPQSIEWTAVVDVATGQESEVPNPTADPIGVIGDQDPLEITEIDLDEGTIATGLESEPIERLSGTPGNALTDDRPEPPSNATPIEIGPGRPGPNENTTTEDVPLPEEPDRPELIIPGEPPPRRTAVRPTRTPNEQPTRVAATGFTRDSVETPALTGEQQTKAEREPIAPPIAQATTVPVATERADLGIEPGSSLTPAQKADALPTVIRMAERIESWIKVTENAPPPRSITLRGVELQGMTIRVSVLASGLSIQIEGAKGDDVPWLRQVVDMLNGRGFNVAEFSEYDGEGEQRPLWDDDAAEERRRPRPDFDPYLEELMA